MNLYECKKCDCCGEIYPISSWEALCADGECSHSRIKIYGEYYDLCAKCTYEVFKLIKMNN